MVKRGRRLSNDTPHGYIHPVTHKHTQKKYAWVCERCGREFIFKEEALECEARHFLEEWQIS